MERTPSDRERIRILNDEMRAAGPEDAGPNRWMITPGIQDLDPTEAQRAIEAVKTFTAFNQDNDPHGEHDFVDIEHDGEKYFAKVDYYDASMQGGSEDPADPEKTTRVLTIMRADEY